MEKKVVFLFHGMGNFKEGWAKKDFIDPIIKAAKKYHYPLEDGFEEYFVPINYNDYFEKILKNWQEDFKKLSKLLAGFGLDSEDVSKEIVSKIGGFDKAVTDEEFLVTHFGDVVLYKVLRDVKSKIIMNIIVEVIEKIIEKGKDAKIHFVGHSLGTAVAADTIDKCSTMDEFHGAPFETVHMFANVSHLIRGTDYTYNKSRCSPLYEVKKYFNYRHVHDPFTLSPYNFKPSTWNKTSMYKDYSELNHHILEILADVHSFEHYIRHPEILRVFLNSIQEKDMYINKDKKNQAMKIFEKETSLSSINSETIKKNKEILKKLFK